MQYFWNKSLNSPQFTTNVVIGLEMQLLEEGGRQDTSTFLPTKNTDKKRIVQ